MQTIWKYELKDDIVLPLPSTARVLSVGAQGDTMVLWALLDKDEAVQGGRRFKVYGMGWDISAYASLAFVGTVFVGPAVYHVFEDLHGA
jgi:hypothetical protein